MSRKLVLLIALIFSIGVLSSLFEVQRAEARQIIVVEYAGRDRERSWEVSANFSKGEYIVADYRPDQTWLDPPYEMIEIGDQQILIKLVCLDIICPEGNNTVFLHVLAIDTKDPSPVPASFANAVLQSGGGLIVNNVSDVAGHLADFINETIGGQLVEELGGIAQYNGTYRLVIHEPYPPSVPSPPSEDGPEPPSYLALCKIIPDFFAIECDGYTFNVTMISSEESTVLNLNFSQWDKEIRFDISGPANKTGYNFVTIPKDVLQGDPWKIYINTTDWTPLCSISENETHAFIYIPCSYSTNTIRITGTWAIPEFPSYLILPLFMMATLLAVMVYRRKYSM